VKHFTLKKKVGGITLPVPIYVDEATTDDLIRKVNRRMKELEDESGRIDTQAYALLTALAFAEEARAERERSETQQADLLRTLKKLTEALRSLLRDFHISA
jgi:cell division protein ZapA (FtsZ GTPase activity inhibitor)